jgi:GNAT superfamily N-acetyltransferase
VTTDFETFRATTPLEGDWAGMTFPSYRPLLSLAGSTNPTTGGTPIVRCARQGDRAIGLAIAEVAPGSGATAELFSIFVAPDSRGRGVGTALVEALEADVAEAGATSLGAVYMTGKPSIPIIERIFEKRGFAAPVRRTVVVRFTPEEAATTDWYRRAKLPAGATVFPWKDLTDAERAELRRSQEESPWIHPDLEPWRCDERFDEVSSVGMRKDGQVVGWVINHPIAPGMICFTTSFMRRDLARRGAIFSLYVASLERLKGTGVTCTFVTASHFESMVNFVLRRCAQFISFCGETRGVSKALTGASVARA